MPFRKKQDIDGKLVDFDLIYRDLIHPAIEAAGMEPIRADEETVNGIIHKPMYERLILCDYALADLTTANANVFYELGIRHAVKPFTTVTIMASGSVLPFDLNAVRCYPYGYAKETGLTAIDEDKEKITQKLVNAKKKKDTDSPVYQLVDGISFQNSVAHQKTDIFRDLVTYNQTIKDQLEAVRNAKGTKAEKIKALEGLIAAKINPENEETGVLIDAMLTFRSLSAFDKMIDFINNLPSHVKNTVMVQEQLGFALNRIEERQQAVTVLETVIRQNGPSSETYGILGRVYKDMSDDAAAAGNKRLAKANFEKAIETYQKGFEADWRDAYPGTNVLTLLEIKGDRAKINELAPVVIYAVQRKLVTKTPDYWDYASLLEIAIITNNESDAETYLDKALACPVEGHWMFETTAKTLDKIVAARKDRDEDFRLAEEMSGALKEQIGN